MLSSLVSSWTTTEQSEGQQLETNYDKKGHQQQHFVDIQIEEEIDVEFVLWTNVQDAIKVNDCWIQLISQFPNRDGD